jgi:putative membrane protein
MTNLATLLIGLVALSHIGFLAMEMFFWQHPVIMKNFGLTPEFARQSAPLAANQGLYNGFLAAGLIWALASGRLDLKIFFLGCVVIAGAYGAMTVKSSILFVQALPAALALLLVWWTHRA